MYLVIELQKNGNSVSNIVTTHSTLQEAESKYHLILSSAAISNVEVHSALMIRDNGQPLRNESFSHQIAPEPEPQIEEPEGE